MGEGEGGEDLMADELCGDVLNLPEENLHLRCDREKGHVGCHNDTSFTEAFWSGRLTAKPLES